MCRDADDPSVEAAESAVSDLKAPELKPGRRQARHGGILAPGGRWWERPRPAVPEETRRSPGVGDPRCRPVSPVSSDPDEAPHGKDGDPFRQPMIVPAPNVERCPLIRLPVEPREKIGLRKRSYVMVDQIFSAGTRRTLMRQYFPASTFAAPVSVAALALGMTVPAASRLLISTTRRTQRFASGETAAPHTTVLLSAVTIRADEHLAPTPGTPEQPSVVHGSPPARRAGRSEITGQYCTRSRTQVRIWAQPRTWTAKS